MHITVQHKRFSDTFSRNDNVLCLVA